MDTTRIANLYMERLAFPDADQTYNSRLRDVMQILRDLETEVKRHAREQKQNPQNWGFVGDMNATKASLQEALDFLQDKD